MTNDQITKWALEAGWPASVVNVLPTQSLGIERMKRFASLVRNATLEEAAKLCDRRSNDIGSRIAADEAGLIAEQIRSMKS